VELKLEHCTLRPYRPDDEPALVRHANNRNVSRNMRDRFPYPYTTDDARAWIARVSGQSPVAQFAIVVDGQPAGGIGVEAGTDVFRRSAEIGYWLGEPYWGRGLATEALRAVTEYAFQTFDICRLEAGVFEWNPASARVLEKAGYAREGTLKSSAVKYGVPRDQFIYARINESWRSG
jgi:ribosomal-protein-alanine N-acetyltransferase